MTINVSTLTTSIENNLKTNLSADDKSLDANMLAIAASIASAVAAATAADLGFVNTLNSAKVSLTDADHTLDITQGNWFVVPASTLGAGRTLTLDPTTGSPADGAQITITRLDATANTLTIKDGGSGTPTLIVLPVSKIGSVVCQLAAGHWLLREMPAQ